MIIFTNVNRNNYYRTNSKKLINLVIKYRNFIFDYYYYCEYKKFKYYFIRYFYCINYLKFITYYNYSGKLHRDGDPAFIEYYNNGEIKDKEYWLNGKEYSYEDYLLEIKKIF